ncbi:hypothetical protein SAMN02745174_02067 [Cetobacterium ceti]|uniref:Nucleotidyltransferase n=1 Tax=Cetobacterium ceti TaxID=180163 RepID=A0A1T4PVR0_9FUSO|nr:nucleotidyltransferase [Cetobacterium ceti]SJZ95549.1 hypothetical protein SAMN02745174_02067 [Cetobacterium ceti]
MSIVTLKQAQNKFLKEIVDLEPGRVEKARKSRDFLKETIKNICEKDKEMFNLYPEYHIDFGSFARNTKIRPLDDIDMMFCFKGEGSVYDILGNESYKITVPTESKTLIKVCEENNQLNSRKVIEKIKAKLYNISNYNRADIKRNQEAITLKLNSYEWNFDIVPCFICNEGDEKAKFYLIPDGNGNWKKTDPRKDRERIKELNNINNGSVYQLVRLAKKWSKQKNFQSISSYLLENLVLEYVASTSISNNTYDEFESFLDYLKDKIYEKIKDPKGIQDDLNNLEFLHKYKISIAAQRDAEILRESNDIYLREETKINFYIKVFGNDFPKYGDN